MTTSLLAPLPPLTSSLRGVTINVRPDADNMSTAALAAFRSAVAAALDVTDDRGYLQHAGIHGLPLPKFCHHHDHLFLPWHRAYLYFFELALQDLVPGVSLPWWDWTSERSHASGIPAAYDDVDGGDGAPNPLRSVAIPQIVRDEDPSAPEATFRTPYPPEELPLADDVEQILRLGDFLDFSGQVEQAHDWVHMWTGGTMSEVPVAAYDPLFWAHHAMIDRVWRLWQLRHPTAGVPNEMLDQALPPFPMTVRQTLSVTALGYDYAVLSQTLPGPVTRRPLVLAPGDWPPPRPLLDGGPVVTDSVRGVTP
jgi:tyrosinase